MQNALGVQNSIILDNSIMQINAWFKVVLLESCMKINEKLMVLVTGWISNRDEKSNGLVARGLTVSFVT